MIISVNRIYTGPIWGTLIDFDKQFRVLIDCGWIINSDASQAEKYVEYLDDLDLILISHPTLEHIGALPYLYSRTKSGGVKRREVLDEEPSDSNGVWTIPIVCTDPVFRVGRIALHDSFENYKLSFSFNFYQKSYIDEALSKCTKLRYKQSFVINLEQQKFIVKPYPSGHTLGGTVWSLNYSGREIVYSIGHRISPQWPIQGASFEDIKKPSLFITDVNEAKSNEQEHLPILRNVLRTISKTLKQGGSILIPVDADGLFLELLIHFEVYWRQNTSTLGFFPIIFLSPIADSIILSLKTMIEWMDKSIQEQFIKNRFNPLDNLNHITIIHSEEELKSFDDTPKVIFSTPGNFDYGFSKVLFEEFVVKKQNLIVFTRTPAPMTLTDQIWNYNLARDAHEFPNQQPPFVFNKTSKSFQQSFTDTADYGISLSKLAPEENIEVDYIPETVLNSPAQDEANEFGLAESFRNLPNTNTDFPEENNSLENAPTKRQKISNLKLYISSFPYSYESFENQESNQPPNSHFSQYGEPVQTAKILTQSESLEMEKAVKNSGSIFRKKRPRDHKLSIRLEHNDIPKFQCNDITLGSSKRQLRKLLKNNDKLLNQLSPNFDSLTLSDYDNTDYQRLQASIEDNQQHIDESDDSTDESIYDDSSTQDQSTSSFSLANYDSYVYQEEKITLDFQCKMLMCENLQGLTSQSMLRLLISRISPRRVCLLPSATGLSYHLLSSYLTSSNLPEASIHTFYDQENVNVYSGKLQNQLQLRSQIEISIPSTELMLQLDDDLWKEFIWSLNHGPDNALKPINSSTTNQSPFYSFVFANISFDPSLQIDSETTGKRSYFNRKFNDRFWTSTVRNINLIANSNKSNIENEQSGETEQTPNKKKLTYSPEDIPKFMSLSELPNSTISETLLVGSLAMKNIANCLVKLLPDKVSYAPQGGILTISDEVAICRKSDKGNIIWEIEGSLDPAYYFTRKLLSSQFRSMSRQL